MKRPRSWDCPRPHLVEAIDVCARRTDQPVHDVQFN